MLARVGLPQLHARGSLKGRHGQEEAKADLMQEARRKGCQKGRSAQARQPQAQGAVCRQSSIARSQTAPRRCCACPWKGGEVCLPVRFGALRVPQEQSVEPLLQGPL